MRPISVSVHCVVSPGKKGVGTESKRHSRAKSFGQICVDAFVLSGKEEKRIFWPADCVFLLQSRLS